MARTKAALPPGSRLTDYISLLFSTRGERKCVRGASIRGARSLARGGVFDHTLSTTSERNEVVARLWRAFAVRW